MTFSGEEGYASNDNVVQGNVISNSKIRFNVESWWPDQPGAGAQRREPQLPRPEQARRQHNGGVETSEAFSASANRVVTDAGYADLAQRDLRLVPGGPCDGVYSGDNIVPGPDARGGLSPFRSPPRPGPAEDSQGAPQQGSNPGPAVTLKPSGRRAIRPRAAHAAQGPRRPYPRASGPQGSDRRAPQERAPDGRVRQGPPRRDLHDPAAQ